MNKIRIRQVAADHGSSFAWSVVVYISGGDDIYFCSTWQNAIYLADRLIQKQIDDQWSLGNSPSLYNKENFFGHELGKE